MPTTRAKNLGYRLLLPFALSPRGRMEMHDQGAPLATPEAWLDLQAKHHVMGSSLLLRDGNRTRAAHTSILGDPAKSASESTLYRVASITKMATAMAVLRLWESGQVDLDAPFTALMPQLAGCAALDGVTTRQLLSHTSGLADTPAYPQGLADSADVRGVLKASGIRTHAPGQVFQYSNFGYGLLGCLLENVTGISVAKVMRELLFEPLHMDASLDASELPEERIMGIQRILSRSSAPVKKTALGRKPLTAADPLRHYGHTAGAMYATVGAIDRLLQVVVNGGLGILLPETVQEMQKPHAVYGPSDPGLRYGLGLFLVDRPEVSSHRLIGHQGFAYGCVDGAFWESGTQRSVVFLNGGASELRLKGKLAAVNLDVMRWALKEEFPAW